MKQNDYSLKRDMEKDIAEDDYLNKCFRTKVYDTTNSLAELLVFENTKCLDSTLTLNRVFNKSAHVKEVLVVIDEKLNKMSNQNEAEYRDMVDSLLAYLILLKMTKENNV